MVAIADDAPRVEPQPISSGQPLRISRAWTFAVGLVLVAILAIYLLAPAFAGPR